ncbi:lantibiotic dehydratase [Actinacidiphila glaucinigra]|uniref:lantibiotic dehydratase n=1 Tax=Actinacidiphila glaucinigra TaxID=235986 RepID=UPI000B78B0BD|nr:lantibiotic dehydratase [Actinacidiphila glaucinigra]
MTWLRTVCSDPDIAEALQHASPVLAARVDALLAASAPVFKEVRRVVLSVSRYLLRAEHRATPFGLFAGVTTADLGSDPHVTWGAEPAVTARAGAGWISNVIERLEACSELLERVPVVVNNTATIRGDRLVVPFLSEAAGNGDATRAVEASVSLTEPLHLVLSAARAPITVGELADKLATAFPSTGNAKVRRMISELVHRRVLITSLHAPSTHTDALGYLLEQLDALGADSLPSSAPLVSRLQAVAGGLRECATRPGREAVTAAMCSIAPGQASHPLAVDLAFDAQIGLPASIAREVERTAWVLTRVSAHPFGTAQWSAYHMRFYERYGIGTMVPLQDVVADSGIGFPDGYPGASSGERRPRLSARDEVLVRLAQSAVLDGLEEVVLTDELVAALDVGPEEVRVPPHLEIGVRVHATGVADLRRGRFRLEVASVSRGAGVSIGRFLDILRPGERAALYAELADLPAGDSKTVPAQVSFPPLLPQTAHVARAPKVLSTVISLQEHRVPGPEVLTPADLAVGCDGRRMYVAAPGRGQRIEPVGLHALNLVRHTPPLARLLAELPRAQCAQVTLFDWGAAAAMPFLPRVRYGRTVLAPARWRLEPSELPGRGRCRAEWDDQFAQWRVRRRLPQRVFLAEGDQRLFLDLDQAGYRTLLRHHLDGARPAVLVEAPGPEAYGWCEGRAHEIVVPVKATRPPAWPALPAPTWARAASPAQVQAPAGSSLLLISLYGDIRRQDAVLANHVPALLARLGDPAWWFVRFRDPDQHLRLRIALPGPGAFAKTARTVSAWADELREAGLLSDLRFPTSYRELGRWGSGPAWEAAEEVFRADSRAVLAQLRQYPRPHQRALVAAHFVAIASAFLGSTQAGMRWLIGHVPPTAPGPVPREHFIDAVHLADPSGSWAALREIPGGAAILAAWADRDAALAAYRPHLPGPDTQGIDVDDVLTSLLHVHFVRHVAVNFPEEEICLYLARAAALAFTARTSRSAR